jgi:outer membrane lipoprotein-sorting protein
MERDMKTLVVLSIAVLVLALSGFAGAGTTCNDPLLQHVVSTLKQNLSQTSNIGAQQKVVTTKLSESGTPKRIEEKSYKTTWVQNRATNELVSIDCKEIDGNGKSRRCSDVLPVSATKSRKPAKPGKLDAEIKKVRWADMYKNYDFSVQAQEGPYYVLCFKPKNSGLAPQTRIEKILTQMAGKIWVDKDYNIVRAEARLVDPVSFALGVAAKVHSLSLQYRQQVHEGIWLPSSLNVEFKARIALLHTERQRIEVSWFNTYRQSDAVWVQAGSTSAMGTQK